jgi:hypothetical protein
LQLQLDHGGGGRELFPNIASRFTDAGKLSSIIPGKTASIMCGESAVDTWA